MHFTYVALSMVFLLLDFFLLKWSYVLVIILRVDVRIRVNTSKAF